MNKQDRIPVFLSSDDNYASYMAALMVSIMDNTETEIDFYIIDAGISAYNKRQLSTLQKKWGFGLEFIDPEPYRHLFTAPASPSGHITKASSDRFLVPSMKPELDRVIVLDVDMIALGDIKKLWDVDLQDKIVAAVPPYCWTDMVTVRDHRKDCGMHKDHIYFNMGALLVDCKKWRDMDMLKKLSESQINFDTNTYYWWDEIVLNLVLQVNNYKILDPKFNMMVPHQAYYKHGKPNAHKNLIEEYVGLSANYSINEIIFSHYAMRHVKPWNTNTYFYNNMTIPLPNFKEFWHYMKLTPFYEGEYINFLTKQMSSFYVKDLLKAYVRYFKYKILCALTLRLIPSYRKKLKKYKKHIEE